MTEDIIKAILDFIATYKVIVIIILVIANISLAIAFLNQLIQLCGSIARGIAWLCKLIFKIIKLIFKLVKLVVKALIWIIFIYKRYKHKKMLKESIFNVIPCEIKIPLIYRLLSHRVRKQAKYRYTCLELCFTTKDKIENEFKFITMIEASVGGGKTSFLNGFAHVKTISLIEAIDNELYSIEKRLYHIDYYFIRKNIEDCYLLGSTEKECEKKLLQNNNIKESFSGTFDDHVSEVPTLAILRKYITTYYAKLRNNYIMSNYKMLCRITNTFNYELDPNIFNIRDVESQKRFYIPSYSVIVDDEKALSLYKNTESAKNLDNLGADVIMRLFRQLRDETTYYISSTQNTSRIALIVRELANTYISIQKFSIIGEQHRMSYIYHRKEEKTFKRMNKYARRHFSEPDRDKFLLSDNKYKARIFDLWDKQKALFASSFVKYKIRLASKLNDLQTDEKTKEFDVVFPLTWVYGVYRTCEYSEFNDFLMNLSEVKTDHDLKVIASLYEKNEDRFKSLIEEKKKDKKAKKETSNKED